MRRYILLLITIGAIIPPPVLAEDFTFRRVKVPTANSTAPRITVQIDPSAVAEPPPVAPPTANADVQPAASAWFWGTISTELEAANPGRIEAAVKHLANAPVGTAPRTPRLQHLQQIARLHGADILLSTVGTDVSPALVLAVISVESAGRTDAESSAGAVGLMQLMPATADRFGVKDRTVAAESIKGGVAYLDLLMKTFNGDPLLALAAYNAGENAVLSRGAVPPYAETRDYVPKVLAAWQVARGLCLTPPELASDGCVFAGLEMAQGG